jgi:tetratricopeptide (TPR) repeat protein
VLRDSCKTLEEMGERGFLSTTAGFLSHTLYAQGEYDESARFSRTCEQLAAPDDAASQMLWRRSRAKLLAREGNLRRAEELAREAVELAEKADYLNEHANAIAELAEIHALAGRRDEAMAGLEEAAKRYELKGNRPALERARAAAAKLASA